MIKKNIPTYELPLSMPIIFERIEDRSDAFVNNPHRHKFYEILWFKNDGGNHIVDFQSFQVKKDTIFFLAPGKVHQMDISDKEGFLLVFSQNFMSQIVFPQEDNFFTLFYSFDNLPFIQPSKDDVYRLDILFELIILEYDNIPNDITILQTYLRAFLLYTQRIKEQTEKSILEKSHERLAQLFQLIEVHYKTERAVAFYANHLALTPKRVNEITKIRMGKTVTQLVHERLLLEAKRELYFGTQNIKEIAYMLGFKDPAYFSRFFKKQTSITPEQFKTKMFK
ncbi:helix-turn-helix domain-containing protein [Anaerolineales bacterium HSG6]|nr:helix-turn-helix domain-containing protein [Anaerolineales bacterium HSG6]MDM8529998.1 helix-turn-helix domain-containing protein [Anaerolineales bacterium HSG25]